jgi:Domain of unknown function (DUF4340)
MTGRGVIFQGGLAALGLAIAYGTWQREPERAVGEVVVVDATKSDLTNVHFEDETNSVDIQRDKQDAESGVWLRVQDKTPVTSPAKAASPNPTSAPPPSATPTPTAKPRPLRVLRGDEPAEKLLATFAPFRSPRAFGVLDANKLKELGLDKAKKKLTISARGETRQFVIGQPAQGTGENYLRDTADGRVYLMPRQMMSDLQGAAYRLVDRKLHTFKIPDVNRMVIASAGKKREFIIKNPEDPNAYKLAPANAPDKPEEMARNWHDKIWRLYAVDVLGKNETPAGGEPKVSARIDYFDGAKNAGWLEIAKLDVAPGVEPAAGPHGSPQPNNGTELYGRTEHTAGWIRLRSDPSLLTDADKISAGS